jgi:hypothetical protein
MNQQRLAATADRAGSEKTGVYYSVLSRTSVAGNSGGRISRSRSCATCPRRQLPLRRKGCHSLLAAATIRQ